MVKLRGVDVSVKLVGDIARGKNAETTARVVEPRQEPAKPRVDIKTEVETYGAGKIDTATVGKTPLQHGGAIPAGKGVLGFMLGGSAAVEIPPVVADPTQTKPEDLAAFVGKRITYTVYDPEEYDSLANANKRGDSMTSTGILQAASAGELVVKRDDGRTTELDTEMWRLGEVEVSGGEYSWKKDASMTVEGVKDTLLPGAEVSVQKLGNSVVEGRFLGTGSDARGGYIDVVDKDAQLQRVRASDVYDVRSPGFSFTALLES